MQYKYLDRDTEYLPEKPQDSNYFPDAEETSSIKIDYFQSIGGPKEYAKMVEGGHCVFEGTYLLNLLNQRQNVDFLC